MKKVLLLGAALLFLSGCAGADYQNYAQTMADHSSYESQRIAAQSAAISEMVQATKTETAMEGMLLAVIGMLQVERLQPVQLEMTKPTTGSDVGLAFVNHVPFMSAIGGMVWQASILSDNLTGMTLNNSSINGSYNPTTAVGSGGASAVGTATPTVVEPFIVRPEIVRP